jgi:uncharacterized protein (TIGR03437 family)
MRLKKNLTWLFLGLAVLLPAQAPVPTISTVGSNSTWGGPINVKLDGAGNMYVADWGGHAVYKIDAQANITTVAGSPGKAGSTGDGASATLATLNGPSGVAVAPDGTVYITCLGDNRIRKVSPNGIITTFAGTGRAAFGGDGGPSTQASLDYPLDVIMDSAGNLYIADYGNYRIRKITPGGTISTIAGTGRKNAGGDGGQALATDMLPAAIAFGPDGSLYYADAGLRNDLLAPRVRRISPGGVVSTVAGNGKIGFSGDGGPATAAMFTSIDGVAVDPSGNVYAAEYNGARVRKVDAVTGIITSYAGTGRAGLSGDAGPASQALLWGPIGLAEDPQGSLYICEYVNKRVRKVSVPNIPSIKLTDSGVAAFFGQAGFSSNMYMDITGTNLSQTTRTWNINDFNGSTAPLSLDGVSATVNGKGAFVRYVSPTQIGIIIPDDTATGPVPIQIQAPNGPSNNGTINRTRLSPTLQPATQFSFGGKQYVLAQTADFRFFVGSPNVIGGFPISAVRAGDTIVIYALGCGPTDPPTPAGTIAAQDSAVTLPVDLRIGGVSAGIVSAVVVANTIGVYQFVVTVPAVAPGDQTVELIVDGVSNAQNLLIVVGQ